MARATADNEDLFQVIQRFQAERCGRPFCSKYGAFGTGIGWRIRQRRPNGDREPELCLRVFVEGKPKNPRRKLPPSFPYTFRGRSYDIPVDVCQSVPKLHARPTGSVQVLSPSSEKTRSGFEARAPQCRKGALGGWMWDPNGDSLVMLSCWHVLGNTAGLDASNLMYDVKTVAKVRKGVPVKGGREVNRVDCACADPVWKEVRRRKFLEKIPPVLATAAPRLSRPDEPEVSRFRRWEVKGGTMLGGVDAVSVEMYITYNGVRCWFTDLFIVRRDKLKAAWGEPGDSGSLVFGRQPVDQFDTMPVLGVYMGRIKEGKPGKTRMLGVACRMDNVVSTLQVEEIRGQPIHAFLDSLVDFDEPLQLLAERRSDRPQVISRGARGRSERLFDAMRRTVGRAFVGPLLRQRRAVVGLLVESEKLRAAAAAAMRPILRSGKTPQAIMSHVLTTEERTALIQLVVQLRGETRLGIKGKLKPYLEALRDEDRKTFGDVLRLLDERAPDYAALA